MLIGRILRGAAGGNRLHDAGGHADGSFAGRHRLSRRSLLATTASILTFGTLLRFDASSPPGAAATAELWTNVESARRVGRSYLAQVPEDADADRLSALLFDDSPETLPASPEALRQQIAHRREHDFATGDTVIIDGWILSRTEARLCALTALA